MQSIHIRNFLDQSWGQGDALFLQQQTTGEIFKCVSPPNLSTVTHLLLSLRATDYKEYPLQRDVLIQCCAHSPPRSIELYFFETQPRSKNVGSALVSVFQKDSSGCLLDIYKTNVYSNLCHTLSLWREYVVWNGQKFSVYIFKIESSQHNIGEC